MKTILAQLQQTNISDKKSLQLIGDLIRKEFDTIKSEDRAFELLQLAYKWQIPQFDEMLNDYSIEDFKWFM